MASTLLQGVVPRSAWLFALAAAASACGRADRFAALHRPSDAGESAPRPLGTCSTPVSGVVVSTESIAGLSTHATLRSLKRRCGVGDSALYDAGGWQAKGWTFPFVGAHVVAVQTKYGPAESVHDNEVPDLWAVDGDSVRLPDGHLIPTTLGMLRSRYGVTLVDENLPAADVEGPHARACRFPYLRFALDVNDTARNVPDSARVTRVDLTGTDNEIARFCRAHRSSSSR